MRFRHGIKQSLMKRNKWGEWRRLEGLREEWRDLKGKEEKEPVQAGGALADC